MGGPLRSRWSIDRNLIKARNEVTAFHPLQSAYQRPLLVRRDPIHRYVRDNRTHAVTTNENAWRVSLTGDRAKTGCRFCAVLFAVNNGCHRAE